MHGLRVRLAIAVGSAAAAAALAATPISAGTDSFVGDFHHVRTVASTVPQNGDVNPYGVAVVPASSGRLAAGDVLVSNFNDAKNRQGTGTTIVEISPAGRVRLFAGLDDEKLPGACPGGVGLTTALVALRSGWVVVGSLPTRNGTPATMKAGCLIVLDANGTPVETISGPPIDGPWDMTAADFGGTAALFVTNVLNGTVSASPNVVDGGTVVRIGLNIAASAAPQVVSETVIGTGFPERTDPAALVVGPTGVGLAPDGTLFVADSVANRIAAIPRALTRADATTGRTLSSGGALDDPLGLAVAPNGDVLTTNGGDGNLVETTERGAQVAVEALDDTPAPPGPNGNGTLFGLAVAPGAGGVDFVDDGTNTLDLLH